MGAELTRRPRAAASETCPKGHFWYECAASRFVGCCSIDPCVLAAARCPVANQPVTASSSSTLVLTETASISLEPVSSALASSAVSPVALSSGTSPSVATTIAAAPPAPSVTTISPSLISTQGIFIPAQSTVSFTVTFTAPFSLGQSSIPSASIITSSPSISRASTLGPSQIPQTAAAGVAASSSSGPLFTAGVIAVITMGLVALLCAVIALVILLWWRTRSIKTARARRSSSSNSGDDDDEEEEAVEMRTDGLCLLKSRRQPSQPRFHAPQQRPDDSDAAASGHVGAPTPPGPKVGFPELVRPFGIRYPPDVPSPNGSSLELNAPWPTTATRTASQRSSGATMPATPLSRPPVAPWSEGFPTAGGRISDRADSLRNERLLAGTGAGANASDVRWSLSDLATVSSPRRHSTPSNIYTPRGRQSLPSAQQHRPSHGAHPHCVWHRLSCALAATGGGSRRVTTTTTTTLTSRPTRAYSYGGGGGDHRRNSDDAIISPFRDSSRTRGLTSRSVVSRLSIRDHPASDNEYSSSGGGAADSGDSGDGGSSGRRRRDSDTESVLLTIPVPGYAELEAADCYYELTPPPRRRPQSAEGEEGHQEQQEQQKKQEQQKQEQQQQQEQEQQQQQQQPQQEVEAGAGADEGRVSRSSRLSLSGVRQGFAHKGVEEDEKGK